MVQVSDVEGFGPPIAEALTLGTDVIATSIRPLDELILSTVQFAEPGDIVELFDFLRSILGKPKSSSNDLLSLLKWNDWAKEHFH